MPDETAESIASRKRDLRERLFNEIVDRIFDKIEPLVDEVIEQEDRAASDRVQEAKEYTAVGSIYVYQKDGLWISRVHGPHGGGDSFTSRCYTDVNKAINAAAWYAKNHQIRIVYSPIYFDPRLEA
jgi:hypothetical protein